MVLGFKGAQGLQKKEALDSGCKGIPSAAVKAPIVPCTCVCVHAMGLEILSGIGPPCPETQRC